MTEKNMSEHGLRTRAGKLLSSFIRQIAEEHTELVKDPRTGEDRMGSKAEALARLIWKKALGYTEQRVEGDKLTDIFHHPDKYLMSLLFDRMEGRAPMTIGEGDEKISVAERVSEQGKKRIGEAGGINTDD